MNEHLQIDSHTKQPNTQLHSRLYTELKFSKVMCSSWVHTNKLFSNCHQIKCICFWCVYIEHEQIIKSAVTHRISSDRLLLCAMMKTIYLLWNRLLASCWTVCSTQPCCHFLHGLSVHVTFLMIYETFEELSSMKKDFWCFKNSKALIA